MNDDAHCARAGGRLAGMEATVQGLERDLRAVKEYAAASQLALLASSATVT